MREKLIECVALVKLLVKKDMAERNGLPCCDGCPGFVCNYPLHQLEDKLNRMLTSFGEVWPD